MAETARKRTPLHTKILLSLVAGGVLGIAAQFLFPGGSKNTYLSWFTENIANNVGSIFLTMIFMIVVPLLFSALTLGIAEIGDATKVGRIGLRALYMTVLLSGIAVVLGIALVNLVQPGIGLSEQKREELFASVNKEDAAKKGTAEQLASTDPPTLGVVPRNPILEATRALTGGLLPFMFFSLVFGIALSAIDPEKALPLKQFLEGLFAVSLKVIDFAMLLAPIGVFCLVFRTGAILGFDLVTTLGKYVLIVLAALAFHQFVVYTLVIKYLAKRKPREFFRQMKTVMLTAFATSSSNATLPTALKAAEEDLGLPRKISTFVLTVGATGNQNGTALFEGITILFLAQFVGVQLDLSQQFQVMLLAIVAGIGTAGVPGGSWPMIAGVIQRFNIPVETIGIVLGIDRILDMSRTVLNVTGDMTIAACVAKWEGEPTETPEEAMA
jgi:DAACS family dicarboxylate/amino acid:cation (Na+ or H+) symporter